MSDQRREITLSFSTFASVTVTMLSQCSMADDMSHLAKAADVQLCIEGAKAGLDMETLPKPCQSMRRTKQ